MVRIGLFGGVSATTDGGVPLDIGPAKSQVVLAVLALSAGSAVPVARLVDLVWGDQPPRTAEKTLQSYIVRLRTGLGADSIVRTGSAYCLAVPVDAVDVARFRRQLDSGAIEAALVEWTGTPLAGLDAHGLTPIVNGLVEQWLGAVETDLARRVETDALGVIGPLTELTANYPFREGLWSLLMTALYRVGRQADALAAFQHARGHLVEQLGVEPGLQLMELESRILDHDERLSGGLPSDPPAARPTGTVTFGFCEVEDVRPIVGDEPEEDGRRDGPPRRVGAGRGAPSGWVLVRHRRGLVRSGVPPGGRRRCLVDRAATRDEQRTLAGGSRAAVADRVAYRRGRNSRERLLRCGRQPRGATRQRRFRRPNPFVRSHCRIAGPQRPTGSRRLPARRCDRRPAYFPTRGRRASGAAQSAPSPRQHPATARTTHRA